MKYELSENTMRINNTLLHQIRALENIGYAQAGELGGYVESESNLSQRGRSWIRNRARVTGNAFVCGDAQVKDDVWVFGDAHIRDEACVHGSAQIYGKAYIRDEASVGGIAAVFGDAWVFGRARVFGYAHIFGNARISQRATVCGTTYVCDNAWVTGNAYVSGATWVIGRTHLFEGRWLKTPLYIAGSKYAVSMQAPKKLQIGCRVHTISKWLKRGEAIGKAEGLTPAEIVEYMQYVEIAARIYDPDALAEAEAARKKHIIIKMHGYTKEV